MYVMYVFSNVGRAQLERFSNFHSVMLLHSPAKRLHKPRTCPVTLPLALKARRSTYMMLQACLKRAHRKWNDSDKLRVGDLLKLTR